MSYDIYSWLHEINQLCDDGETKCMLFQQHLLSHTYKKMHVYSAEIKLKLASFPLLTLCLHSTIQQQETARQQGRHQTLLYKPVVLLPSGNSDESAAVSPDCRAASPFRLRDTSIHPQLSTIKYSLNFQCPTRWQASRVTVQKQPGVFLILLFAYVAHTDVCIKAENVLNRLKDHRSTFKCLKITAESKPVTYC